MSLLPKYLLIPLITCIIIAGVSTYSPASTDAADSSAGRPEQAVLVTTDQQGTAPDAALLSSVGGGYLSPISRTDRPFTHMLLRWEAFVPVSATLTLDLRASLDGTTWTDWGEVHENADLWMPSDGEQVHWSDAIYAGEGMRFWQLRATFSPAPDGRLPELRRIEVNTVDARFGPENPTPEPTLNAIGKPSVVSRTGWGSPDGQSSRVQPVYYAVNHMVVHHSADSNSLSSGQSWADRVRAIWSFHTFTRGWGDIGYNYLVDPNGVIYEGRAGGDDAVAFHDTANYGSMGVVMIGTYDSVSPQTAAVNSLVELLSWKAEQKRIDPLGRSYYYGCTISNYCKPYTTGGIVENIAGHRQVTPGHTECPGNSLLNLLPTVRQRVSDRLNGGSSGTPDNGDLTIDELEAGFTRSAANWYDKDCGYGGHSYYTFATNSAAESTNNATWRPNLPAAGIYRVLAYIPHGCGLSATANAHYRVYAADGAHDVYINQSTAEEWISLGSFQFAAGQAGYVALDDLTGEPFSQQRAVFFDSVRWVMEDPSAQKLDLVNVQYDRDSVAAGELLKITFTVHNSGSATIEGQEPQAGTLTDPSASFDLSNSYVYDEGECFLGATGQDYPAFPKQAGHFRVMLGPSNRTVTCDGNTGGYPWRWGINGRLAPGATADVVGYVRFRTPGTVTLRAGAIHEYVNYMAQDAFAKTITVTPERLTPAPAAYDARLRPVAQIYRLGAIPDNLLARTQNALSVVKGEALGSFPWYGQLIDWGSGGPLAGINDGFIVEQTRVFVAPKAGEYTFQTTSDDGSWLWVDGTPVVMNIGLHEASSATGSITLSAGRHVLSYKYFERSGLAAAGYSVRMPGGSGFGQPIDGLGGNNTAVDLHLGNTYQRLNGMTIVADDQGGSGVNTLQVSFDGTNWTNIPASVFTLSALQDGSYTLRYRAVDAVGNQSATQQISFRVDSTLNISSLYLPMMR